MSLKSLWTRIQSWGAPVAAVGAAAPLAPPAIAQEQFSNTARTAATIRQERTTTLYERVVKANNAYVTRNEGFGDIVVHEDRSIAPISASERLEMTELRMGVAFRTEPDLTGK